MSYNGWSNRETWLVNLHFGDSFESMVREDVESGNDEGYNDDVKAIADGFPDAQNKAEYVADMVDCMAERYEDYVMEHIQPEVDALSGFLADFLDLGLINWEELAMEVVHEIFF